MKNLNKRYKSILVFILTLVLVFQSSFVANAATAVTINSVVKGYHTLTVNFEHPTKTNFEVKLMDSFTGGSTILNWTSVDNGTTSNSYTFTNLDPDSEHEIKVRVNGNNATKVEKDRKTLPLPQINLVVTPDKKSADLTWTYDYMADSYEIKMIDETASSTVFGWTDIGNVLAHTLENLEPDNDYEIKIRARKDGNVNPNSFKEIDFTTLPLSIYNINLIKTSPLSGAPSGPTTEFVGEGYVYQADGPEWFEVPVAPSFEVTGGAVYSVSGDQVILNDLTGDVTIKTVYPLRDLLDASAGMSPVAGGNDESLKGMAIDKHTEDESLSSFTKLKLEQESNGQVEVDVILDPALVNGSLSLTTTGTPGAAGEVEAVPNSGFATSGIRYVIVKNLMDDWDDGYDGDEDDYYGSTARRYRKDHMENVFSVESSLNGSGNKLSLEVVKDPSITYDAAAHLEAEFIVYVTADFYNVKVEPVIYEMVNGSLVVNPAVGSIDIRSGLTSGNDFLADGRFSVIGATGGTHTTTLQPDTEIQFKAKAETHYEFIGWKKDVEAGDLYPAGQGNPRTVTVVEKNKINKFGPAAVFKKIEFNLEVIVDEPGSIASSTPTLAGQGPSAFSELVDGSVENFNGELFTGKVGSGEQFNVAPSFEEGHLYSVYVWDYLFQTRADGRDDIIDIPIEEEVMGWVYLGSQFGPIFRPGIALGEALPYSLIMGEANRDMKYLVLYDPMAYRVEVDVHPDSVGKGSVSVSPDPEDNVYFYGDALSLVATPNSGQRFVKWWGEFEVYPEGEIAGSPGLQENNLIKIYEPILELRPIVDVNSATDVFTVDGSIVSDLNDLQMMYPLDFFDGHLPTRIFAEFETAPVSTPNPTPTNIYTLTVTSTDGGSVPGEGLRSFSSVTNVILDPAADDGFEFSGWTGDTGILTGNVARVDGDYVLEAVFTLIVEEEPIPEEPAPEPEPEPVPLPVEETEEILLDEATAEETPAALPEAGGVPAEGFSFLGLALSALGVKLRKKI